jgi:hypothetical protein
MFGKIYSQNSAYTMTHVHVDDVVQNCLVLVVKIIVWHELYLISLPIYLDQSATGAPHGICFDTLNAGNHGTHLGKLGTSNVRGVEAQR